MIEYNEMNELILMEFFEFKKKKVEIEFCDLLIYEREYWESGFEWIVGIDEVGRGCLFGDVVVVVVILFCDLILEGVNDFKKLIEKKCEVLYDVIMEKVLFVGVGFVDVEMIDCFNIK